MRFIHKLCLQILQKRSYATVAPVGILGAPFSKGQPKDGVELAPNAFRNFGLIEKLRELDVPVKDYGNLEFDFNHIDQQLQEKCKYPLTVGAACQKVSAAVRKVLEDGRVCITLGGDHSLGIGTLHGHSLVYDICVLWVDAHADINTPHSSLSGNIHGMPLSFVIGELGKFQTEDVVGFEWLAPCVKKNNLAYIGLRDVDPFEKLILKKEKITHFTMRDIDELGIIEVTRRALQAINPSGMLSLHVSFDVDSLDTVFAPSTGTPVLGGLTAREALCFAEEISKVESLRALDVVEVNPLLGSKEDVEKTLTLSVQLIKSFLGYSRRGMMNKGMEKNQSTII